MAAYTFQGYRRANGAVGVRNHVVILPVDGISNRVARNVSHLIQGTVDLKHAYGDLQFGKDLELFFRTMIGAGANPNVAAAVVVGMEPNWLDEIASGIEKTGKPVARFVIGHAGDLATTERAARKAQEFVFYASEIKTETVRLADIVLCTKCSESDPTSGLASNPTVGKVVERALDAGSTVLFGETSELTGAEQMIADRIKKLDQKEKFWRLYNDYVGFIENQRAHLLGSQPCQSNIRGGLSTIEEKAFGNVRKIGTAFIEGVLESGEAPGGKGLWFMNTSSAAAEVLTLFAAAGSVLCLATTGQGNIIGSPLMPVIKMTANPRTAQTMAEHIDLDVSGLLRQEISLDQAADMLADLLVRVAGGRWTASETLKHHEFVPVKLYRSA